MSSAGSRREMTDAINVYLSRGDVVAADPSGEIWRYTGGSLEQQLDALVERLDATSSTRTLRLWLSGALCRPVLVPPIAGAASQAERDTLVDTIAVRESGLVAPCRVAIGHRRRGAEDVAVVIEAGALFAVERRFASARIRALSIRPWWDHALEHALRIDSTLNAFATWEGDALTILTGADHGFSSARTVHPVCDADAASAAFARALVSSLVSPQRALAVRLDWTSVLPLAELSPQWAGTTFDMCIQPLRSAS